MFGQKQRFIDSLLRILGSAELFELEIQGKMNISPHNDLANVDSILRHFYRATA